MVNIGSIRNRMKMNSVITDIKNKIHREEFHTKAIPYHGVPFHDQIQETQEVLLQLGVEIKTRHRALNKFAKVLENARTRDSGSSKTSRENRSSQAAEGTGKADKTARK